MKAALAASAVLLFVSVWILVPAPNSYLLPLAVGAPELSPLLLAVACLLSALAAFRARRFGTARLSLIFAITSGCLAVLPLVQLPPTLQRFDTATARTRVLRETMRTAPVIGRDLFLFTGPSEASISHTVFAKPGGVPLTLTLYKGKGTGPRPILVQIYGGAWQHGGPDDDEWFGRYFAARGYAVVAIDHRHAPQWKWPVQLDDVRDALAWVDRHAAEIEGDRTRMVLVGRSSGAQLAMAAAYLAPQHAIRAVVSFYGPVDLADGWRHPPTPDPLNVRGVLEAFLGGTPDQAPDVYRAASPITYASRALPPTLLIYGGRDHIVEARFGVKLDEALRKNGNTSVLLTIPWAEHRFDALPTGLGAQVALYYAERFLAWSVR